MVNLVNNVSFNLLNAELYSKCSNTAVGVYRVAKAKGDSATMERSMGYAGSMSEIANNAAGKIDDDLQEALKKVRAQEKEEAQKANETRNNETTTENSSIINDSASDTQNVSTQEHNDVQKSSVTEPVITSSGNYSSSSSIETTPSTGTTVDLKG